MAKREGRKLYIGECNEIKALEAFAKKGKDGRVVSQCKVCTNKKKEDKKKNRK